MQHRIYFDITNILEFAYNSHRVTGIQRVQLRIIANIIMKHGSATIKGAAYNRTLQEWQEVDLAFLACMSEFDAMEMLFETSRLYPSRLPPKNQVKKYLAPYSERKVLRGIKKASLYLQSFVSPSRTSKKTGLSIYWIKRERRSPAPKQLHLSPCDTIALLGANWSVPELEALAKQHAATEGHVVQMIHDLIPYCRPEFHTEDLIEAFNSWLKETPNYTQTYLCVSNSTANDLKKFLGDRQEKVRVITTPLAHEFSGYQRNEKISLPAALQNSLSDVADYVLCVGSIEIRKNGAALIHAWEKLRHTLGKATPTLIFAGKKGWKINDFEYALRQTDYAGRTVRVLQSPSDQDLAALYSNCLFTIYPSLYEGWGLPVGESAWLGKFAIVSAASSIPEVCGELVDYLDPNNLDDMVTRILRPLKDRGYLAFREKEIRNSLLRTWDDVADDVFQHLQAKIHDAYPIPAEKRARSI